MQEEIKQKLEQLKTAGSKELKREILEAALIEIAGFATCGCKAFPQDAQYLGHLFERELLDKENVHKLQRILFHGTEQEYDRFCLAMYTKIRRIYQKYFESHTSVKDGVVYNSILDMYWDPKTGVWSRKEEGWDTFTFFMPYENAATA